MLGTCCNIYIYLDLHKNNFSEVKSTLLDPFEYLNLALFRPDLLSTDKLLVGDFADFPLAALDAMLNFQVDFTAFLGKTNQTISWTTPSLNNRCCQ